MTTGTRTSPTPTPGAGPVALLVAAASAVAALGYLPAPLRLTGPPVSALVVVVALGVAAGLARRAPVTAHPTAWRWYAAGLLTTGTGLVLSPVLLPADLTALGAIPGQLLVLAGLLRLVDRRAAGVARPQLSSSVALFLVADLLLAHTALHLTRGLETGGSPREVVAISAVLLVLAPGNCAALLHLWVSPVGARWSPALLLTGRWAVSLAALVALLDGAHPVGPLVPALLVLAMGAAALACHADVPAGRPVRDGSPAGALIPHVTAMVAGTVLLVSASLPGGLSITGTVLGVLGLAVLVLDQKVALRTQQRLTADLQRSEAYFRTLVRGSADPVVILDEDLTVRWTSPAITDLLGLDPDGAVGLALTDVVHPEDLAALLTGLDAVAVPGDPTTKIRTARVRHAEHGWRLIQARVRDLRADPDVGALVLYCRDAGPAAAPSPALDPDLGTYDTVDPATGLPNRSALTLRLATALRVPGARPASLVVLGVDGLPGSDAGEVLRELTARLTRVLRADDWPARVAADEFAVLVDGGIAEAETVATRLVGAVEPVTTRTGTARLTAAAGVVPLSPDVDAGEALGRGDLALRSARAAGPGRVRRHDDALRITRDRAQALRADLACALDRGQLHLVYQPVVDLALHRTTSVEALLRWRHPVYGDVSPAEFIPLAEESALVTELGRWVLAQATAMAAALPHPDLAVAVNISARHVRGGELVPDVLAALAGSRLPATRLVLEITESVLLDDAHVTADLEALRRLGVRIAVDDFGTGWSSLAYLVGLPIDVLKMDRQFLASLETDPQRRALCSSVLHLGDSLGLAVVVEGVETRAELQLLRDMGHRYIQGFLLARPVPADELEARLADLAGSVPAAAPARPSAPVGARFPRVRS